MAFNAIFLFLLFLTTYQVCAQENVQKNLPKSIQECYNNTELLDANLKMPMTMNLLIDLIRKVENGPVAMDLKVLSSTLLYRFRQDGIRKAQNARSMKIIPYSPSGHEFDKFIILFKKVVPGNSVLFPNETLTGLERCTFHQMLSESTETIERGDESFVCNKKEKYRLRITRAVDKMPDEVELLSVLPNKKNSKGNILLVGSPEYNPNTDVHIINQKSQPNNVPISSCPLERGVVYSKWGAVSAGNVIAGIAAGSEPQTIPVNNNKYELDNVFGATLAGDIAEAGYLSVANGESIVIGADGNWLSSLVPHGYYLEKTKDFYLTNAEIRGSLDGLILGTKMKEYRNSAKFMKLSQLLDMYYSQRGVFGENLKACRRQELYTEFAPSDKLKSESAAFALMLHKIATVTMTLHDDIIVSSTDEAVEKLSAFIPSNLRDVNCLNDNTPFQTIKADIVILLDCSWNYEVIYSTLSYFLDNTDINPYNSNYTIINAQNGKVIIESQNSIAEFHERFNKTFYDGQSKGFDISVALQNLETIIKNKMEIEKQDIAEGGGRSFIGLFIARSTNIDSSTKQFIINRLNDVIKPTIPDLKLLAFSGGPKEDFVDIVRDLARDFIQLTDNLNSDSIISSVNKVITRLRQIPTRIFSFQCGANWTVSGNERDLIQYVEPTGINYHRLLPNYFFQSGVGTRRIKIKGHGIGILNICYSRDNELPTGKGNSNSTNGANDGSTVCKSINNEEFVFELNDPCQGSATISDCASLYISVQPQNTKNSIGLNTCQGKFCRYPDNIKYTISMESLGCYSNGNILNYNIFMLICILFVAGFKNL